MIVKNGIYKHYKGKYYAVIGICHHSETLEELVLYVMFDERPPFGKDSLWARPVDNFMGTVEVNGKKVPRYEYIGETLESEK